MRRSFLINNSFVNTRLDRWFKKCICNVPQSLIEKNIRKGKIKVNNKKEKSSYKLKYNDEIFIYNINLVPNKNKNSTTRYIATKKEVRSSSEMIIENNENFVVINKPAGIAVQSGTKSKKNIIDILRTTKEFEKTNPYTVHRIDKETTGLLIVAKNRKYAQLFTSLFRIRKIHKVYLCVVIGELKEKKGKFVDELFYYENDRKIKTKAITHFNVLDTNNKYSLVKLTPETGRKHQLRKQLLIHGHPIIGDSKYNLIDESKKIKKNLMLHAYKINFTIAGTKYNFFAELPIFFKKFLNEKYLKIS